tara:strand:+ start:938 stop:2182 length:1245 start_codon:yes stop_codon:yes gene_type:complete
MAVTITQSPTLPNGTQSDLIYVLTSSNASLPQHRYVCEVRTEGGTVLSQVKQVRNNQDIGVFEVSRLLDDHMGYDEPFYISGSNPFVTSSDQNILSFKIVFGEEYGSTTTSPLTSSLNVSASNAADTTFIPAVTERDAGYFNWPSSSYNALTNMPNTGSGLTYETKLQSLNVGADDYMTISSLCGIAPLGHLTSVRISVYTVNSLVHTETITNPFPHLLTAGKLVHTGIGPKNLASVGSLAAYFNQPTTYPYYSVRLQYASGNSTDYFFNINCSQYTGTRFAFTNKLGMLDYYRATLVDTEAETFTRETYQAPYINYSTDTSTITYDSTRRGEQQYLNQIGNLYTAETDWLTTEQSTWLFELFESPNVFVQNGDQMEGIIIVNAGEQFKTNPRGQKTFKFTIRYRKSNSKHSRY